MSNIDIDARTMIDVENIVKLLKKLDTVRNYGYIVEDSVYSEDYPDSGDRFDYDEYEENCPYLL